MSAIYSGAFWNSAQPRAREPFRSYTASITQQQFVQSLPFGSLARNNSQQGMRDCENKRSNLGIIRVRIRT
jgi:hypothetical protein